MVNGQPSKAWLTVLSMFLGIFVGMCIGVYCGVLQVAASASLTAGKFWFFDITSLISATALVVTMFLLFFYTYYTMKIAKQTHSASVFNAIATITKQHNSQKSYRSRRHLNDPMCLAALNASLEEIDKTVEWIKEGKINIDTVLKTNKLNSSEDKLIKFNSNMKPHVSRRRIDWLEAIEGVLLDFDLIALPMEQKLKIAKELAEVYQSVFEKTADILLPFIAIQKRLRSRGVKEYKRPYLELMSTFPTEDPQRKKDIAALLRYPDLLP